MTDTTEPRSANREAIEAWNGVLFDKFLRFRHVLTEGLAHHGDAALKREPPAPGSHVLDIGCGFGDTTLWLGALVGPEGRAIGIDAAPRFIDIACKDATAAGCGNVAFRVADVECDALGGPYALVFSRFGTMFFANPVGALANIRNALAPGGRLCMVVWRRREDNPVVYYAQQVVEARVAKADKGDQVTCGPGPFSMASADLVSDQLIAAGFTRISFQRHDAPILIGHDMDDAIEFALSLGPAGEHLRPAGAAADKERPHLVAALREKFQPHLRPDGVWLPSSTWLVSAIRRERT
jgi:ubiquinone/menaquinone biosynthesis C-methylase UbiE